MEVQPAVRHRITSLDGLRGIAAVVVVVHHCMLLNPVLYAPVSDGTRPFGPSDWWWWLTYTPLHTVWAGTEAVYVFFVLSGIVLTFAASRPGFTWRAYFPQRLMRLYLPVWGAVLFAYFLMLVMPRAGGPSLGPWIDERPRTYGPRALLHDGTLLFGHSGIVSPLWSLRWELWFSLALPLYLLLRRCRGAAWWVAVCACVGLVTLGGIMSDPALTYLPMFGLGVLLASSWSHVLSAVSSWSDLRWTVVTVLAVLILLAEWLLGGLSNGRPPWSVGVAVVGAALLVVGFGAWGPLVRAGEAPVTAWLGRISFSLYLVHDQVIVTARYLLPAVPPWALMPFVVAACLVVGWLFFLWVERPLHRLSRRVGRRARAA